MREHDETTAYQLHGLLLSHGYNLLLQTIFRCRTALGWTFRGSAYCQLIRVREENKQKRLAFVEEYKDDGFEDAIYTDECMVQLESHRRFCCRKRGEAPRPKPRCDKRLMMRNIECLLLSKLYNYILHVHTFCRFWYLATTSGVGNRVFFEMSGDGRLGFFIFQPFILHRKTLLWWWGKWCWNCIWCLRCLLVKIAWIVKLW